MIIKAFCSCFFRTFLVKNNQFIFQCLWYVFLIDKLLVLKWRSFPIYHTYPRNFNTLFFCLLFFTSKNLLFYLQLQSMFLFFFGKVFLLFCSTYINIQFCDIFLNFPWNWNYISLEICLLVYCQINFKLAKLTSNFVWRKMINVPSISSADVYVEVGSCIQKYVYILRQCYIWFKKFVRKKNSSLEKIE